MRRFPPFRPSKPQRGASFGVFCVHFCFLGAFCHRSLQRHLSFAPFSTFLVRMASARKMIICPRKNKSGKKGGPFWAGISGGPVGIVENHGNIKKFQQYSKAVGGRPARGLRKSFKILARASKILQIPCPGSSGAGWPRARGLPGLQNIVSDDHL